MAEIMPAISSKKGHANRFQIPRVDLTPMVDLGFLLLTFFVFSSAISSPSVMTAIYPDDRETIEETQVPESGALTLLLGSNGEVFFHSGLTDETGTTWQHANIKEIRKEIASKKSHTAKDDFVVLIKPGDNSDYGSLVSILDEMKISMVDRYNIVEPSEKEKLVLKNREKNFDFVK